MAAARGRGLRPGGVVRALARLALFVVVGFGVGLVFGIVTEEPELLAGYLSGEGTEVPLDVTSIAAGGAPVGGDAPDADAYAPASDAPRPLVQPAERAPELPAVAGRATDPRPAMAERSVVQDLGVADRGVVPSSARATANATETQAPPWAIQVGAFSEARAAERLARGLRDRYPVVVVPATSSGGRHRVRVQPIASEAEARAMAERLKQEERLPTWVTRAEARR